MRLGAIRVGKNPPDDINVIMMEDESGMDDKVIAVPTHKLTQRYDSVKTVTDLPEITRSQIEHFFAHCKDLEPGKGVKIVRWGDVVEARRFIVEAIARGRAT